MRKLLLLYMLLAFVLVSCNSYRKALRKHQQLSDRQKLEISSIFVEATRYRILGDGNQAGALYQRVIDEDPLHDAALFELGKLKLVSGEYETAAGLMKLAMKVDPDNEWYVLGYATVLEQSGQYQDAAEQYLYLQKRFPDRAELYGSEAQCYMKQNQFQKAIDVYDRLEQQSGINEETSVQKYYIYMNWGKTDKAMSEIQKLARLFPDNTQYQMALAEYYMQTGKAALAYQAITAVLAADPGNALARAYLADYYHMSGNNTLAVREIGLIISGPNTSVDEKISIFMNILQAGSIYGDTTSVYPMLDTLIALHADDAKSWAMYADFLNQDDRIQEAVGMWKRSIGLDSSRFVIWDLVLGSLYDDRQYDSLALYASRAVELFPEQGSVWFFAGAAAYEAKQYVQAEEYLAIAEQLILRRPEMLTQTRYLLAETYLRTGDPDKSDALFGKLISENPGNVVAKNRFAYSLALRNHDLDQAIALSGEVFDANSDKTDFLHTRGLILFRQGKFAEALEMYSKAVKAGGDRDGALLEHYGDALYFNGRTAEALANWKLARDMGGAGSFIDKKISEQKYVE